MVELNSSVTSLDAISSLSAMSSSWVVTVIVFLAIFGLMFIVSKNLRQFLYGAIPTAATYGIYRISRWIGIETSTKNNYVPIIWFVYIVGFIVVSVIVGRILQRTRFVKKIEKELGGN